MKELDVNEPMMCRDMQDIAKVEYLTAYVDEYKGKLFAFLITYKDGYSELCTKLPTGRSEQDVEYYNDIINIPETPEFGWGKPIRHIETGDICVFKARDKEGYIYPHPWTLVFKNSNGNYWSATFTDDAKQSRIDNKPALENYESDERYGIKFNGYLDKYTVLDSENEIVGAFSRIDDAELFKSVKEQGL